MKHVKVLSKVSLPAPAGVPVKPMKPVKAK